MKKTIAVPQLQKEIEGQQKKEEKLYKKFYTKLLSSCEKNFQRVKYEFEYVQNLSEITIQEWGLNKEKMLNCYKEAIQEHTTTRKL